MSDVATDQHDEVSVEDILRDELAHGDMVLGTVVPILGHLVTTSANMLFSDEIVAQVRGMIANVSDQILTAHALAAEELDPPKFISERRDDLAAEFMTQGEFLSHCHALTVEQQLADKLYDSNGIDPVLSPMLQALIASDDEAIAAAAMATLTAQARFVQKFRRMELSVNELPGDLFHSAILAWRRFAGDHQENITANAEMQLRAEYDEAASRLGLMSRLVSGLGSGLHAALSINHAGIAMFLTALATGSGQERDVAVLSTNDRQMGRLALSLKVAGLRTQEIEEQFIHLHPEIALPNGFDLLNIEKAAELLAESNTRMVG